MITYTGGTPRDRERIRRKVQKHNTDGLRNTLVVVGEMMMDGVTPVTEGLRYLRAVERGDIVAKAEEFLRGLMETPRVSRVKDGVQGKIPWTEKQRPQRSKDVVGGAAACRRLKEVVSRGGAAVLIGVPGVGKTTLARLVVSEGGQRVFERNASDSRGEAAVREAVGQLDYAGMDGAGYLIMEEVDGLSAGDRGGGAALAAAVRAGARVICTCNEETANVAAIVRAGAVRIEMGSVGAEDIKRVLVDVVRGEEVGRGVKMGDLRRIAEAAGGDVRQALVSLELAVRCGRLAGWVGDGGVDRMGSETWQGLAAGLLGGVGEDVRRQIVSAEPMMMAMVVGEFCEGLASRELMSDWDLLAYRNGEMAAECVVRAVGCAEKVGRFRGWFPSILANESKMRGVEGKLLGVRERLGVGALALLDQSPVNQATLTLSKEESENWEEMLEF